MRRARLSHSNSSSSASKQHEEAHAKTQQEVYESHSLYSSVDGRSPVRKTKLSVKRVRLDPSQLHDDLADWCPMNDNPDTTCPTPTGAPTFTTFGTGLAVEGGTRPQKSSPDNDEGDGKRKRYQSTDEPMNAWRPHAATFFKELFRQEASPNSRVCENCEDHINERLAMYRCLGCSQRCFCEACLVVCHQERFPLHRIQRWTGDFWTSSNLGSINGFFVQLGHNGLPCVAPMPRSQLVVIDLGGIFTIPFSYCGCNPIGGLTNVQQLLANRWFPSSPTEPHTCATFEALEFFRLLQVAGSTNARDFVTALEKRTDAMGQVWVPDRYKSFLRMSRQYAFLKRCKRSGVGNSLYGLAGTGEGDLRVQCWQCPHEGVNIPDNWREVAPKFFFLFTVMLAMDANFRLKNRIRKNEHSDASLGPGWSYFVESSKYKDHLKNYVSEQDVSTCISFEALRQKDTKVTTGLRVSGVGAVCCARHEVLVCIGDLQKGERYSNMDYLFFSALLWLNFAFILVSYDIACQWAINLWTRMLGLPSFLHVDSAALRFLAALPVWHAAAHELKCKSANTLSHQPGAGKNDGEGIERLWAFLNTCAAAWKECGEGLRMDSMDDKIDFSNFQKNVNSCDTLMRRLLVAIEERDKQVENFKDVNDTLEKDLRKDWAREVADWNAERFLPPKERTKPNPYISTVAGQPTEAKVREELKKREVEDARNGRMPMHSTSATAFLAAGLQLEDIQRRIRSEVSGSGTLTQEQIEDRRIGFFKKLKPFRDLQHIYMPGAVRALAEAEESRDSDAPPLPAESIKLWFPSDLPASSRQMGCCYGLVDMEISLRRAQCSDALNEIRSRIHAWQYLIRFRNANVTGQNNSGKSARLIGEVRNRIELVAEKYRDARRALLQIDSGCKLRDLTKDDLTSDNATTRDAHNIKKLSGAGSSITKPTRNFSEGRQTLSWIWTAAGLNPDDDSALHDAVRVEWCRARARRDRWVEEVMLLREEMRRTLRFLDYKSRWWLERANKDYSRDPTLNSGLKNYAKRQTALLAKTRSIFMEKFGSTLTGGRMILEARDVMHDETYILDAERDSGYGSVDH